MATSITSRPAKELEDGFLSRWNSITLPLVYQFTNNKFPLNSFDSQKTITDIFYDGSRGGTVIEFTGTDDLIPLDKMSFQGTGIPVLDGTVQSILPSDLGSNLILIDFFTNLTSQEGRMQKFYTNYKVLVNVYKGAPFEHPYEADDTKPLVKLGTIEIDFTTKTIDRNEVNFGSVDVHTLAEIGTGSDFDNEDENSRNSWNAFFIEFAESHDQSNGSEILTFTDTFTFDLIEGCQPEDFGFVDPSFDFGLDFWTEEILEPPNIAWVTGVGFVTVTLPDTPNRRSELLQQTIGLIAGVPYVVDWEFDFISADGNTNMDIIIYAFINGSWAVQSSRTLSGLGVHIGQFTITTDTAASKLGVVLRASSGDPVINSVVNLNFIDVSVEEPLVTVDPNFNNGLDFWREGGHQSSDPWVGGVGFVVCDVLTGDKTNILYQDLTTDILPRTAITVDFDWNLISGNLLDDIEIAVFCWTGTQWLEASLNSRIPVTAIGNNTASVNVFWELDTVLSMAVQVRTIGAGADPFEFRFDRYNFTLQNTVWKNSQFINGLDDWFQTCNRAASCISWVAGVGSVSITANETMTLYQELIVFNNESIHVEIDFETLAGGDITNVTFMGRELGTQTWFFIDNQSDLGVGTHNLVFDVTIDRDFDALGFDLHVLGSLIPINDWIVTRAELTGQNPTSTDCLGILYGAYGTNQFQNALGGNFGDFIAQNENSQFMTGFDEYRYFFDSPFYASIIITEALFSASLDQNSVFLEIDFLDNTGASLGVLLHLVEATNEGVYHIAPDIAAFLELEGIGKNDWKTAKMILIQQTGEPAINQISQEKILNNALACAPSFSPVPMRFLNASGGWDTWTWQQLKVLDEVRSKNVTVKKDILRDFDNVFINGDTQYQSVKIDSRKTLLLRSLTLTEEELVGLSQLCNSVRVQIFTNDNWTTVSVDTNSMNVFNEEAKIRTLTLSVRLPDTLNQTS